MVLIWGVNGFGDEREDQLRMILTQQYEGVVKKWKKKNPLKNAAARDNLANRMRKMDVSAH